jgi:hypothetical protein
MDRQPTDGGMWLGATSSPSDPRPGCLLRRHIRPTCSLAWHSRSSDVSTLTLAERICGAIDRFNPPGMPRPYCCGRRATPAPHPHVLHGVLQHSPNASLIRQGCAGSKDHSARRAYRSAAGPGWAAPMRADLIFDRDTGLQDGKSLSGSVLPAAHAPPAATLPRRPRTVINSRRCMCRPKDHACAIPTVYSSAASEKWHILRCPLWANSGLMRGINYRSTRRRVRPLSAG